MKKTPKTARTSHNSPKGTRHLPENYRASLVPFVLLVLVPNKAFILWRLELPVRRTRLRPTRRVFWRGVKTLHSITGTTQDRVVQDLAGGGGSSWA